MKLLRKITFSCLFFVITFSIFSAPKDSLLPRQRTSQFEHIRVGWYDQYPFTFKKNIIGVSIVSGMDIELNRDILDFAGYKVELIEAPWEKQLTMLRNGEIDLMLSGLKNRDRMEEFYLSLPIRKEKTTTYVNKFNQIKSNIQDIDEFLEYVKANNLVIGVTKGNIYTNASLNEFISSEQNKDFIKFGSCDYVNLSNLRDNKVDIVFVDNTAGSLIVGDNGWGNILINYRYPEFNAQNVYYMLSKVSMNEASLKKINNAIGRIKDSGKYESTVKSYLMPSMLNLVTNSWWYFYIVLAGIIANCICALVIVLKENQSLVGTFIFVTLYALGGAAIRGIITGSFPLFFVHNVLYVYTIIIITAIAFILVNLYGYFQKFSFKNDSMLAIARMNWKLKKFFSKYVYNIIDSIGLAAFIVFGVVAALEVKATPFLLWGPILAMITTTGGGVICNILSHNKFDSTMRNMYTEISAVWGFIFSFMLDSILESASIDKIATVVVFNVAGAFVTRLIVNHYNIRSIMFLAIGWKNKD